MQDIENYEGRYKITKEGKVWSISKGRFIKETIVRSGVSMIKLYKEGEVKQHAVHRLVAKTFIPNPLDKPQVDHIDGDKQNNYVNNLRWCTNAENQMYRDIQGNSGKRAKSKAVAWGEEEFTSIKSLSRHISNIRGSKPETVLKELKAVRYGPKVLYGKLTCLL